MPHESTMRAVAYRPLTQGEDRRYSGFLAPRDSGELRGSKEPKLVWGFCEMCYADGVDEDGWARVRKGRATLVLCDKHHEEAQRRAATKRARKGA